MDLNNVSANELITFAEHEAGSRFDEPGPSAISILMGAISKEMGMHKFTPKDYLAVGINISNNMNKPDDPLDETIVGLILSVGPDEVLSLSKMLNTKTNE